MVCPHVHAEGVHEVAEYEEAVRGEIYARVHSSAVRVPENCVAGVCASGAYTRDVQNQTYYTEYVHGRIQCLRLSRAHGGHVHILPLLKGPVYR